MDIYEMDYLSSLTQDYADKHPLNLLLRMLLVIALSVGNLVSLINSKAKTAKEKVQVGFALITVATVLAYMFIVGAAVVNLVRELPQFQAAAQEGPAQEPAAQGQPAQEQPTQEPAPAGTPDPSQTSQASPAATPSLFGIPLTWTLVFAVALILDLFVLSRAESRPIQQITFWLAIVLAVWILVLLIRPVLAPWIVVLIAVAQLAWPKLFENLRQGIQQSAIHFLSIADYFKLNTRREPIEGHFLALLEYVGQEQGPYERLYVLTYSFGAIVALDGMFPATHDPAERVRSIDGLVTIGNPSDFFRGLWRDYFRSHNDLERGGDRALVWLNVFSPIDILGSNFRPDDQVASPDPDVIQGIGLKYSTPVNVAYPRNLSYAELNFLELVSFIGLRAHTTYFQSVAQGATSCFIQVMPQLLKDTAWLA
jgi:hypothetical protein